MIICICLRNLIYIITKNLVNVAMRSDAWFYIIFMYLYNKNVLKYAQILVTSGRFMIFHIEGHSNIYSYDWNGFCKNFMEDI